MIVVHRGLERAVFACIYVAHAADTKFVIVVARNGSKYFFQNLRQLNPVLDTQLLDEPEKHSFSLGENAITGALSRGCQVQGNRAPVSRTLSPFDEAVFDQSVDESNGAGMR